MSTNRHVVIGAGPVGTGIAKNAAARGHQVTIVTRSGSGPAIPGVRHMKADVTDPDSAREVIAPAAVVYQAAQPAYTEWPEKFPPLQSGVVAATAAAEAVLVAVENLYMYGPVDRPMTEDMPYAATSKKGIVRGAMATELADLHASGDLRATAGRASDFYGPGVSVSSLAQRVFPKVLAGKNASVLGDPDRLHTYTYIDDFTPEQQAEVVMENYDPDFGKIVRKGDILVSGFSFGSGSSREQAATALKYRGVQLVIAGSFSQTYKRNAINNGYLVIEAPELVNDLRKKHNSGLTIRTGITAIIDFKKAEIRTPGKTYSISPVGLAAQELILENGLEAWVKNRLKA